MAWPDIIITGVDPPAIPLDSPDLPPDWIIMDLYGDDYAFGGEFNRGMTGVRYLPRGGVPAPSDGPVGNYPPTYLHLQIASPTVSASAVLDCQFQSTQDFGPDPGNWSNVVRGVFVVGDPPMPRVDTVSIRAGAEQALTVVTLTGADMWSCVGVRAGEVEGAWFGQTATTYQVTLGPYPDRPLDRPLTVPLVALYPATTEHPAGELDIGTWTWNPMAAPPFVDSIDPAEGYVTGGTPVNIYGGHLLTLTGVTFGSGFGTITYREWDHAVVISPPGTGLGPVEMLVINPQGSAPAGTFTYIESPFPEPPRVTSAGPLEGPIEGGTRVSIVGSYLDGTSAVTFGDVPGTGLTVAYGLVTVLSPPAAAGGVALVLRHPYGDVGGATFVYQAPPVVPEGPDGLVCRRRAWLVLGDREMPLEDLQAGYALTELEIGWPEVREVVSNAPDAMGVDDRTSLFGARLVTAAITVWDDRRTMDDIARAFGPYLVPSVRPELHWLLDTPENQYAERMLTLRASAFSAPIRGGRWRDLLLAWSAPDPVIRDPAIRSTEARPSSTVNIGRRYDLIPPRVYPSGAGGGGLQGRIVTMGDLPVLPLIRLYGPASGPSIHFASTALAGSLTFIFKSSYRLDATQWVDVDCDRHTVTDWQGRRQESQVNWNSTRWPMAPAGGVVTIITMTGAGADHITQAQILWRDGYLTS